MPIPLFWRFPGTAALDRVDLCELPTPVDAAPEIAEKYGIGCLWMKRDDLTSGAYGGNKVRKLEFLLGAALAQDRRAVITFGAYGSNHALATAVHSRAVGLEPHVVLSPQAVTPYARATLLAHAALGTRLRVAAGWDGSREAVRARRTLEAENGMEPLVIPMGGTDPLGVAGYVNAAFELVGQVVDADIRECERSAPLEDRLEPPDIVYVAAGTLGTAIGLAIGFAVVDPGIRVVAVRVTPDQVANESIARGLTGRAVALLRSLDAGFPDLDYDDLNLELRHDWFEPGYGVVTAEARDAVGTGKRAGVSLETTYTGKAFAAMLDDAGDGRLTDARVMFWNTYNSAPMPAPGRADTLPLPLQEYLAECDRLFGGSADGGVGDLSEGDLE